MSIEQYETNRLILRPFKEADIERLAEIANDYDIARQTSKLPYPLKQEDVAGLFEEIRNDIAYAIIYEGELVGSISARSITDDEAELSYWLGKAWWKMGIASEAVTFFITHLFQHHDFTRLQASRAKDNPGSGRVLEKVGFKNIGPVLYYSRARDEDVPCWTYRLLKADWQSGNGEVL